MGSLLILLGIFAVFAAIPALIIYFVVVATKGEEALFSPPQESPTQTHAPSPQRQEAMPANYAKNEQLAPAEKPAAKDNKAGSSGFVVLVLAVPAIGIAIAGLGLCILLLALMMSIATFGYSGFFDFALATMKFGGIVFLIGIPIAVLGGIAFAIGKIFE